MSLIAGRHLISIPIIHTEADMGSLRGKVPFDERCKKAAISYWGKIFDYLRDWPGDFSKLKVYQDGLLHATPEGVERIIAAETCTQNYAVLRWLKKQGTTIMGTEGPALLEEYRSLQAIANFTDEKSRQAALLDYRQKKDRLLEERDRYIGGRINSTLCEGETGLLFQGVEHYVKGNIGLYLDEDVMVSRPETLENSLLEVLLELDQELEGRIHIDKERI